MHAENTPYDLVSDVVRLRLYIVLNIYVDRIMKNIVTEYKCYWNVFKLNIFQIICIRRIYGIFKWRVT